ncbi:Serine/threonine-protein phosphatase 5, partial [Zancudomyces culisetae]
MFEKAIESSETALVSEKINVADYRVDDDYEGPRMKERADSDEAEIKEYVDLEFIEGLKSWFEKQKKLPVKYVYAILLQVRKLLKQYNSLVDITLKEDETAVVCGDVHGQYYDVLNIFSKGGLPSTTNKYLFNGDFVDRGSFSLETVLLLLSYKLLLPTSFFLNRGNHEAEGLNRIYGFEGEIMAKYGASHGKKIFTVFQETFNCLPIAHIIQNKVFVVHGGLYSEQNNTTESDTVLLQDIRKINRFRQPGDSGLLAESLWSDPQATTGR